MPNITPIKIQSNPVHQSSTFATKPIAFKSAGDAFERTPRIMPEIEVLSGVSKDFVSRITKQIGEFPQKWLTKLKNEGYQAVLSPTFTEACTKKRIYDPAVLLAEQQNPKGTLGVTCCDDTDMKNLFVFCDKPPYSDRYMSGVVNHELSHGVVNIFGLDKNAEYLKAIREDAELIVRNRKFDKMTDRERLLVSHFFFGKEAKLPIDEIIADCIAWQQKGGGCYGSGLVLGVKNPNLMPNLFPTLSAKVKEF